MDQRAKEIIESFPGLQYDDGFCITSPENSEYNCIALAMDRVDCWVWPEEA